MYVQIFIRSCSHVPPSPEDRESCCHYRGRDHLLGPHGSPQSRQQYEQLISKWYASGRQADAYHHRQQLSASHASPTVEDLIAAFWAHAQSYYRDRHGRPTSELNNYRYELRLLRKLFGGTPATHFGPLSLKAVQHAMIAKSYGRKSINRRINRLRHVFKYAVGEELVPSSVYEALRTVSGLKAGRTAAVETPPVRPATESRINAVIAVAGRHIGTLIELGSVTGMR
ncbi:MAG: site-specific tyrosine recombinase XerC, partial [Phycisphaerales bacterium]|nr:site-specific tyrosine recombinase XerC [Phycisphaerales bacterium]